jgi:hypothetical protein
MNSKMALSSLFDHVKAVPARIQVTKSTPGESEKLQPGDQPSLRR